MGKEKVGCRGRMVLGSTGGEEGGSPHTIRNTSGSVLGVRVTPMGFGIGTVVTILYYQLQMPYLLGNPGLFIHGANGLLLPFFTFLVRNLFYMALTTSIPIYIRKPAGKCFWDVYGSCGG